MSVSCKQLVAYRSFILTLVTFYYIYVIVDIKSWKMELEKEKKTNKGKFPHR